jgi:hypothetical protein
MAHGKFSRRQFVQFASVTSGTMLLAACAAPPAPAATATVPTEPARDNPLDRVIDNYLAAWNEPDQAAREPLLAKVMDENAKYLSWGRTGDSRTLLNAVIGYFQTEFPGTVFKPTGPTYNHHGHLLFSWMATFHETALTTEGQIVSGTTYVSLSPEGRWENIIEFS